MNLIISRKFVLFIIPLFLYIGLLPVMPLMEPDEARYSAISSYMNRTGDFITPHLKETVYLEKPPLCYWATALLFKVFGENELSSRLFAALCAWGCIILTYFMGKFFHGEKTGLYAAAVLTTCLYHFIMGRINILDMPLTFFTCFAIWAGFRYFSHKQHGRKWLYVFYLFSALAFLTKGLIGIVFPFAVVTLWLLLKKAWHDILLLISPVGILLFLAVTLPWLMLIQRENQEFFRFFFIQEHFLRYTTPFHGKTNPFYYYIPVMAAGILPWLAFLFYAIGKVKDHALFDRGGKLFLVTWISFIFIFFSISSSKLITYIAPVFLPIAVFLGHYFRIYEERNYYLDKWNAVKVIPVILQSTIFVAVLLTPPFLSSHSVAWDQWWPLVAIPIIMQILIIFLPELVKTRSQAGWFATIYIISVAFLASVIFPASEFLTPYKSAYPVVEAIKLHLPKNEELYQYGVSLYGIDYYGKIRTPVVDDIGELRFGSEQLPPEEKARYFLTSDNFFELYRQKGEIYCLTYKNVNVEKLKKEAPNLRILWDNKNYYLLHLKSI